MRNNRGLWYLATLILILVMALSWAVPAFALTTQDVTVTATPAYVSISNAPTSWAAGVISASVNVNTGNNYFTITNTSSVVIDISFYVSANWSGTSSWTYGAPGANTARLDVSSANGGAGGSGGVGTYDKTLTYGVGAAVLVCDNVSTVTSPKWEMQLQAPTSITFGAAQSANVTMTAVLAS